MLLSGRDDTKDRTRPGGKKAEKGREAFGYGYGYG